MRNLGQIGLCPALWTALLCTVSWAEDNPPGRIRAFVSIAPEVCFVERVGGAHVEVEALVPPAQGPHTFEPTPKQLVRLTGAQLYFRIGLPFEERLLAKVDAINRELEVVDIREGIALRRMTEHREQDGHGHGSHDPHVWLSPTNAKILAANIAQVLKEYDPVHATEYETNLAGLVADLDKLDKELATMLAPLKGRRFYVYHPAFGYFGDAYGLKQVAVETGGKEPTPKRLVRLIEQANADNVRVIFVQRQFPKTSAEAVGRAIGGAVVPLDPLAADYFANLRDIATKLRRALAPEWD